tara:strand:+ start:407 stop:697 length:291 start_codon:yes stop_codon:yes gene_type:complete
MKNITLKHLRMISFIEGVSYLVLIGVGMPLKYGLNLYMPNKILGLLHGVLTIIFCVILFIIWLQKKLSFKWCIGVFIASLFPFLFLIAEKKLKQLN